MSIIPIMGCKPLESVRTTIDALLPPSVILEMSKLPVLARPGTYITAARPDGTLDYFLITLQRDMRDQTLAWRVQGWQHDDRVTLQRRHGEAYAFRSSSCEYVAWAPLETLDE